MLILNESKSIIAEPKKEINYSLEQFLYESAESYFSIYKEAVSLDFKVLQNKLNGVVEEAAVEAIEEANFGEMKDKVTKFFKDMFEKIGKVIEWFGDKLDVARKEWDKIKSTAVGKVTGKTVTVHTNWKDPKKPLNTIIDMLHNTENSTKDLFKAIYDADEGFKYDKKELSETVATKVGVEMEVKDIVELTLGKKIEVVTDETNCDDALLNISMLLNDANTTLIRSRVENMKNKFAGVIKSLDESDEKYADKNAALFQVLTEFHKITTNIVSAFIKAHEILLAENKMFITSRERSLAYDVKKEKVDEVKNRVTNAVDAIKPKKQEDEVEVNKL